MVNLETLGKLAEDGLLQNGVVTPEVLNRLGVVRRAAVPVKILGNGDLTTRLEVSAHAFSKSAAEKIEKAGGKVQPISAGVKQ